MSGAVTMSPEFLPEIESAGLDPARMPRHVAIIMDGNGRWARSRGWARTRGHRQGADVVRTVTTGSARLGLERLTLYAFSSENWCRPAREVRFLMGLLEDYLERELPTLMDNRIRLEAIGRLERLPEGPRRLLERNLAETAGNRGMVLCLALSYGGRDELVDACREIARLAAAGEVDPQAVDEELLASRLYAPGAPDVDLVIRTAGEQRLSNFLPWQAVYAEYVAAAEPWPEFGLAAYHRCLAEFQARHRRFGRVDDQDAGD